MPGSMYHLELDLSQTGIHTLEDQVPLPYFHGSESNYGSPSDETSHFQYHFLAMIALRRLVARIHESIHCCECFSLEKVRTEAYYIQHPMRQPSYLRTMAAHRCTSSRNWLDSWSHGAHYSPDLCNGQTTTRQNFPIWDPQADRVQTRCSRWTKDLFQSITETTWTS